MSIEFDTSIKSLLPETDSAPFNQTYPATALAITCNRNGNKGDKEIYH